MEQLIIDEIIQIRENRKRPYAESIWNQLVKNGHQYDFSTVAETIRAMEHIGLIENRPHKGEESFFVLVDKKDLVSVTERDTHDDAHGSNTNDLDPSCQANAVQGYTPYEEFVALRHTVSELQRVVQTFNENSDVIRINEIEKLRKENEFLKNELCRKNLIIESLQSTPILDSNFQYGEGFIYPQRKRVAKQHAAMPMQTTPFKLDMNRFAPLGKSNSTENELSTRDERTTNNVKNQQTTKACSSASNTHTQVMKNKNTKTTSKGGSGKSKGSEKKQTAHQSDQKRRVYILGDSMVKGIKHWKMQSKDTKVVVRSFAGAKVRQMKHYAKPAEEDNPSLYILHVGTNDLKENKSVEDIAEDITSLARSLKKGDNEVTVSGICPRGDHLNVKATNVNETLEKKCKQHQIGFIKHELLDATLHTNGSNLHLNQAGDSILAKSFLKEIRM